MNEQPMPNSIEARDIAYHMHGYTNARAHEAAGPLVIERGEGSYVYDSEGKRYLEAMAGLWSTAVGFSETRLVDAAVKQMRKLPFYHNFSSKSHGPAVDLAETLIQMAPVPMSKVYFTNSGSEGNDTVLKMIWYRSNALGLPDKKKVISRHRGYHGVTIASASLTGLPNNHRSFDLPLERVRHTGSPHHYRDAYEGETEEQFASRRSEELEELILKEGSETIAAFWGEPVMGAGGVVVPPATYWEKIQGVLKKYDILFIADEVICGFGRTGNMFGSQTYNIKPDVMIMSKAITSTYFPLTAIMVNDKVYDPIADESNTIGVFGHGFTAGAHPTGAAIAVENLKIIEERGLVAHAAEIGGYMQEKLRSLLQHPLVGEVRGVGMIAAVELVVNKDTKEPFEAPGKLGAMANTTAQNNGLITRNMMDALAFCPPLIVEEADIDFMVETTKKSIDEVHIALRTNGANG